MWTKTFILAALPILSVAQISSCPQPSLNYTAPITLPGFSLTKLAGGLKHPRQIKIDAYHNILVSSLGDGIIGYSTQFDHNGCGSILHKKVIVPDNGLNFSHALILSHDGKTLYASTPETAYSWSYDASKMEVTSEAKVIVTGMVLPASMSITRALAIPREKQDVLLVFRGSFSDEDYATANAATGRSEIKAFDLSRVPKGGYDFVKDGKVFVHGVRDSLDFVQDKYDNFWNVDNGADWSTRDNVPVGNNPADEINKLGRYCSGPEESTPNFGFPYCHGVWNASSLPSKIKLHVGDTFSITPQNVSDAWCNEYTVSPRLSILPHSAPLGLMFYEPQYPSLGRELVDQIFVTYHGPTGHKVVVASYANGDIAAPISTQQGTFDFIWTDPSIDLKTCKNEINPSGIGCLSPVGLAHDRYGRLFITSDETGEIFVVTKS